MRIPPPPIIKKVILKLHYYYTNKIINKTARQLFMVFYFIVEVWYDIFDFNFTLNGSLTTEIESLPFSAMIFPKIEKTRFAGADDLGRHKANSSYVSHHQLCATNWPLPYIPSFNRIFPRVSKTPDKYQSWMQARKSDCTGKLRTFGNPSRVFFLLTRNILLFLKFLIKIKTIIQITNC